MHAEHERGVGDPAGGCTLAVVGFGGVLQTHDERTAVNNHPDSLLKYKGT